MEDIAGHLIKFHRLKQNLSQEGLCKGICVVSYLSKIEQGKVSASSEIVMKLFQVLQIPYTCGESFIREYKQQFHTWFEKYFFDEEVDVETRLLLSKKDTLLCSALYLDYILFDAYRSMDDTPSKLDEVSLFLEYMNDNQLFLYHILKGRQGTKKENELHLKKAALYHHCSIQEHYLAQYYMQRKESSLGIKHGNRAYELACDEGTIPMMVFSSTLLGICYANEFRMELMLLYFNRVRRLTKNGGFIAQNVALEYNIGVTYLAAKVFDKAKVHLENALKDCPKMSQISKFLLYHKLALLYIELGEKEVGSTYFQEATELAGRLKNDVYGQMMQMVELRYTDNYKLDAEYILLLEHICKSIHMVGDEHKQVHVRYLIEGYQQQHRYQEALELSLQMNL